MIHPPEFGEVTAEQYAAMGLRAGLEVHQQLLTDQKLFCRCPAGRYSDVYHAEILRHMRPTLSELGEYDGTALMEFKTRKDIFYRLSRESVCTYEMDDAPPFEINEQAVDIALEVALLLNLQLIDELHIARKQYLDGSIPTGFQRTTILGVNGWLAYPGPLGGRPSHPDRRVGIRQLGLEEDACREVSDIGHQRTYLADRLGMPLIEVVTDPDMRTPLEVAEVGQHIRYLTRATGKVRRGIGACRQDVNVSITGGTRVEIKGVPRIPLFGRLVHYEAFRQRALLGIRDALLEAGADPRTWQAQHSDVTGLVRSAQFSPVVEALAAGHQVWAVRLPLFAGALNTTTQPHTVFLKEFADRIRVVACLQGEPNLVCSDSPTHSLVPGLWRKILRLLQAEPADAAIVVWGERQDVETAVEEIRLRALEALAGVPSETRQSFADGTNGFERILPGPDRMYPDTDLPPKPIPADRIGSVRARLPVLPTEQAARCVSFGVSPELAKAVLRSGLMDMFNAVMARVPKAPANLLAYTLACYRKDLRRMGRNYQALTPDLLADLLAISTENDWAKEAFFDVLEIATASPAPLTREQLAVAAPSRISPAGLTDTIRETLRAAGDQPDSKRRRHKHRRAKLPPEQLWHMGNLMRSLRGRAHGKDIAAALGTRISQVQCR